MSAFYAKRLASAIQHLASSVAGSLADANARGAHDEFMFGDVGEPLTARGEPLKDPNGEILV